jgi:hypothetical protein
MLAFALLDENWSEDDEESGWQADWVRFARNIGGLGEVPAIDQRQERENWIEEATASFARRYAARDTWDRTFEEATR